jgi:hypothetical protein
MIRVLVFNATFNNISAISWRSVLLVEETGVTREDHTPENMIFGLKIVIFHTKYPKYFGASLRSAQFF